MHARTVGNLSQRGKQMTNDFTTRQTSPFQLLLMSESASRTKHDQPSTMSQQQSSPESASKSQSRQGPDAGEGPESDSGSPSHEELPLDQVFEILKNRRRRLVLHYLDDNGGESSLSDLAEHIAAIENDTTVKAISSTQRKRVYVGLYQCHLPKMDDMNIIDFDQNRGTVVLASNAEQVKSYLGEPDERSWYQIYLGLTLGGAALFVAAEAGAHQVGLTPAVVLLVLLVGISVVGIVHAYQVGSVFADESS
jgi:hypothetical protein